ncbi:MAG: MOSC domain-containing protein [Gammaproteobacteria bacterium]|nr:MOSC domain-containing protein [Gammaproteobacteria bacterium]
MISSAHTTQGESDVILSEINLYPIKSAAQVRVAEAEVEARGLRGDRRWMLIDEAGQFLTQRKHPHMALIRVRIEANFLMLDAPEMETLVVPYAFERREVREVTVWRDRVPAWILPAAVNDWLSRYLGFGCALVHMGEEQRRGVDPTYGRPEDTVSFADGFPLLLIGEASLADLNTRLAKPVGMNQFRPNLVVAGGEAYAEDGWKRIRVGECEFDIVKPCARCVLTTVDPARGVADPGREPLRTLMAYRNQAGGVMFGQNLIPRRLGLIKAGDGVEVLA